jgi:hypothetical protein
MVPDPGDRRCGHVRMVVAAGIVVAASASWIDPPLAEQPQAFGLV